MSSELPDYYHILGVSLHASERDIKMAYRRLVRMYHPDVNNSYLAVERFHRIQEAYGILSNPQTRYSYHQQKYPSKGVSASRAKGTPETNAATAASPKPSTTPVSPEAATGSAESIGELFESVLSFFQPDAPSPTASPPVSSPPAVNRRAFDRERLLYEGTLVMTRDEFERSRLFRLQAVIQRPCARCSQTGRVNNRPCSACHGQQVRSSQEEITVTLPPNCPMSGAVNTVTVHPVGIMARLNITILDCPTYFRRDGADVYYDLVLSIPELLLGGVFPVPGLKSRVGFKMTIPPCATPEQLFRLPGKGLSFHGKTGDYYVQVKLKLPTKLSVEEQALYRELRGLSENYASAARRAR